MDEFHRKFLKYAPAYAKDEAAAAIGKVIQLQSQGVLRKGVYYLVLADLVGSTRLAAENGNEALSDRVQLFVKSAIDSTVLCT